jgi:hypothetical protein
MANSKSSFLTKIKFFFFICCLLVAAVTIASNAILAVSKKRLNQTINSYFFKPISIGNAYYLPPNFIIISNFSISDSDTATNGNIVNIPISIFSFSLSRLALNKGFYVSALRCYGSAANLSTLFSFVKNNFTQILDFIKHLPKQDFIFSVQQAKLEYNRKYAPPLNIKADFFLKISGNSIAASGSLDEAKYAFNVLLTPAGISVEKFELARGELRCQLWGMANAKLAEFKGFIFTNNPNLPKKPDDLNLFIFDIDCRMKFNYPSVTVEHLNFSINNNPVKLMAEILLAKPLSCRLELFSNFRGMESEKKERIKNIFLTASLTQHDDSLKTDGVLNIDFPAAQAEALPLERIELNFKELTLPLNDLPVLKVTAAGLNLFCKTTTNPYRINLNDLRAEIYKTSEKLRLFRFYSQFYGGLLEGKGYVQMRAFMPFINATAIVKGADANKLEGILIHFSKMYGNLSSQMSFVNYPELALKGKMSMHSGYLKNFEFFKWLADLFELPSLKKIFFKAVSTDFSVDKTGASLRNMYLDSDDVKLSGYFELGKSDLVSSKISLSFSRELLQKSRKFTPLLNLLHEKIDILKFDFQLSGNLHGMNFQWLQSKFKDEVQKAIPNFVQRGLEKKMEGIIESISKK